MSKVTIVELTPLVAEEFILFQKHYKNFKKLLEVGVFDIRSGSAVLNIDDLGNIRNVNKVAVHNFND